MLRAAIFQICYLLIKFTVKNIISISEWSYPKLSENES